MILLFYRILFTNNVRYICVWNWSNAITIQSTLWILMAWCFSTRPSVATVLSVTSLYGLKMATEILYNQKEGYTSKIEILIFRINISENVKYRSHWSGGFSHSCNWPTISQMPIELKNLTWLNMFQGWQWHMIWVKIEYIILMAWHKTTLTPLLMHWSYHSLALSQS